MRPLSFPRFALVLPLVAACGGSVVSSGPGGSDVGGSGGGAQGSGGSTGGSVGGSSGGSTGTGSSGGSSGGSTTFTALCTNELNIGEGTPPVCCGATPDGCPFSDAVLCGPEGITCAAGEHVGAGMCGSICPTDGSGEFACGAGLSCNSNVAYCSITEGGVALPDAGSAVHATCEMIPSACPAPLTCACLSEHGMLDGAFCQESNGEVTSTLAAP